MNKLLIIGITGTLGNALINKYYDKVKIIGLSRDENKQWSLKSKYPNIDFVIGDIRSKESVLQCINLYFPDTVILCSALKHIDICESNIYQTINTNILGVKNVLDAIVEHNYIMNNKVNKFLFISTDKSCSPINVYGMSKAISERLVTETAYKHTDCKFVCVRYGNVLNSRGSLIPKFLDIAKNPDNKTFPITSEDMTRFFMTVEQSIELISNTLEHGISGDVWIPNIPSFKIIELGRYFSSMYNKSLEIVGIRPGEKIHETLVNESEALRTDSKQIGENKYYIIKPCYQNYDFNHIKSAYTSETVSDITLLQKLMVSVL